MPLLATAVSAVAASACAGRSAIPPAPVDVVCEATAPTTRPAPYPVQFRFKNDGATTVALYSGCIGLDYGVSSCASGFRDQVGPAYHCACSCADASCTSNPACGACPAPATLSIAPGESVSASWDAVALAEETRPRFTCVRSTVLPTGRYRVAIEVFDDPTAAMMTRIGGRVVTRDFDLPAPQDIVDVSLSRSATDDCDASPSLPAAVCTGAEARDVACDLGPAAALDFAWEGGLVRSTDFSQIVAPSTYNRTRRADRQAAPTLECSAVLPRCALDSRVVTTGDVVRVLSQPALTPLFRDVLPVFGEDARTYDGSILVLRRPDGKSLGIGSPCVGCAAPLTPALEKVAKVFAALSAQMLNTTACAPFLQ